MNSKSLKAGRTFYTVIIWLCIIICLCNNIWRLYNLHVFNNFFLQQLFQHCLTA